jgi:hypothetical protein
MRGMRRKAARAPAEAELSPITAMRLGRLVEGSAPGALLVDFTDNAGGTLRARTTVPLDAPTIAAAVASRRPALLLFENADPRLPVIVGLVEDGGGGKLLGELLARPSAAPRPPVEARVDGKRVVIEGQDEIVLRCGEASITLRRDGKVMVRGTYVETQAKGVNRIKGGAVKIN